jgi:hypothetical protein
MVVVLMTAGKQSLVGKAFTAILFIRDFTKSEITARNTDAPNSVTVSRLTDNCTLLITKAS